jgi:YD repeat-containing protein
LIAVTDPPTHTTTINIDPLRDLTLSVTDPGGFTTSEQYDALDRLTAVTKPGVSPTAMMCTYTLSNTGQ